MSITPPDPPPHAPLTGPNARPTAENIVSFLGDIFARRGGEQYLGEKVTMAQHMLQAAAFAEQNRMDDEMIVAALLHDIGHFTSEFGSFTMQDTHDRHHEEAGAEILSAFFPSVVVDCVRHHVAAKRYLAAANPAYLKKLSEASVHSLSLQGGAMTDSEREAFEKLPNFEKIIKIRYLDDAGKDPQMTPPDFDHFAPMIRKVVAAHCHKADR